MFLSRLSRINYKYIPSCSEQMFTIIYLRDSLLFIDVRADDNVALLRPTKQSTDGSGGPSENANDGNINGDFFKGKSCTITNDNYNYPWWAVDLESEHLVRSVVIYNRVNRKYILDNREPFLTYLIYVVFIIYCLYLVDRMYCSSSTHNSKSTDRPIFE